MLETRRLLNAAIVVNTTDDETAVNSTTSLREAITVAGNQAGDDTITFDPAVFTSGSLHTITLNAATPLLINDQTGKVTITGPGSGVLAISAANSGSALSIDLGSVVVMTGMTIKDATGGGGAISTVATLTLSNVVFTANHTSSPDGPDAASGDGGKGVDISGGVIHNEGKLSIDHSLFQDNSAAAGNGGNGSANGGNGGNALGGVIFTSGDLTLDTCTFSGNVASGGSGGATTGSGNGGTGGAASGGAIYCSATSSLAIHDCIFSDNHANLTDNAAGGTSATGNAGSGGLARGGAIYTEINASTPLIDGVSVFSNNEAFGGIGGIGATQSGSGGIAQGGAIYAAGPLTANGATLGSNFARGGTGGNVMAIVAVQAGAGGAALGGAIFTQHADISLTDPQFILNIARGGSGGIAATGYNGGAGGGAFGGAIYSHGDVTITTSSPGAVGFRFNSAEGGNGGLGDKGGNGEEARAGAIFIDDDGSLDVAGEGFSENTVTGGPAGTSRDVLMIASSGMASGGALFSQGPMHVKNCTFDANQATGADGTTQAGEAEGGAIFNEGSLDLADSSLTNNSAMGGSSSAGRAGRASGGAIGGPGSLQMTNSTLDHNTARAGDAGSGATGFSGASASGGGLIASAVTTITNSPISNNIATGGNGGNGSAGNGGSAGGAVGAGIFVPDNAQFKITNSTIANNTATGGMGGNSTAAGKNGGFGANAVGAGLHITPAVASASCTNVTVAYNTATGGAGGTPGAGGTAGNPGMGRGGGVAFNSVNPLALTNTIVANNSASQVDPDLFGTFLLDHCLIGTTASYTVFAGSVGNIFGAAHIGQLDDNGGPTKTILPDSDSPAIDKGNNTAALNEFGANGTDQRGPGFPRFVGTVDIGSVELRAPTIQVTGNGNTIANNDTTPSTIDFTNFGSQFRYAQPLQRTFVVSNTGDLPLDLTTVTVPTGYSIVEPLSATLAKGQSDSFTVQLSSQNPGTFSGDVTILSNDPTNSPFKFRITGTVSSTFKINYQPQAAPVPAGFVADAGLVFGNRGNGLSYGWNLSATSFTRDRNVLSDQARDTLVHTQLFGSRTWEVAVPNGAYQVHLVGGDPGFLDSVYKVNAENVLVVNGTPTSGNRFIEGTQTVIVTDGKLTISNATGSVNNKLDFVEITPVSTPPIRINFQTPTSPTPGGFLADGGAVFGNRGNGQTYGWNLSASAFARDRNNLLSPDQQHDTFIHTQLYGTRFWELALPNGAYSVHIVAGDPNFTDSVYKFNAEGVSVVNDTPTSGSRFVEGTKTVTVSDGRLTITNASGSVNNKIDFIEVTPL